MLILVVDDIEKNRIILDRFLSSQGHDVICAASGEKAIESIGKHNVDLVLMDIKMPGMSGFEATKNIKSLQSDCYLPVIFVTALSEEEALEEALSAGGDDFVAKPIDFGILLSKIKAHERIRELQAELNQKNQELIKHNASLVRDQALVSHFFDQTSKNSFKDDSVIKTVTEAMNVFNGDTTLVGRRPNGGITILLGDFTGHGLAAAVGTLPVSQVFFQMVEKNAYIGDIARELNRLVSVLLPVEMFFAASLIELSPRGDRLMVWHGGMPDAYLYDTSSSELTTVKSKHLPLGVRDFEEFDDSVHLYYVNKSCKFIAFTDGISESMNTDGEMISSEIITSAIRADNENILESILKAYKDYSDSVAQADDVSLVELNCVEVVAGASTVECSDGSCSVPWVIKVRVEDERLENSVPEKIIGLISETALLKDHKGIIHTLINEMYTNALDHGLLGLDGSEKSDDKAFDEFYRERAKRIETLQSAYIETELSYSLTGKQSAELVIVMQHNGRAFDAEKTDISESDLHGRGMDLIEAICDSVVYSDNGRCLTVIYNIA